MKISAEERIVNNYPNKLINRKYRGIRKRRNRTIAVAGAMFGLAATEAMAQKGLLTVFTGAVTLINLKAIELGTNALRLIRPQYLEILNRAKNINKIRQAQ